MALEKDKKDISKAKVIKRVANLKHLLHIIKILLNSLDQYNAIESDVSKNKGDKKVQDKLAELKNKMDTAFTTYKNDVDKDKMDSEDKSKIKT